MVSQQRLQERRAVAALKVAGISGGQQSRSEHKGDAGAGHSGDGRLKILAQASRQSAGQPYQVTVESALLPPKDYTVILTNMVGRSLFLSAGALTIVLHVTCRDYGVAVAVVVLVVWVVVVVVVAAAAMAVAVILGRLVMMTLGLGGC